MFVKVVIVVVVVVIANGRATRLTSSSHQASAYLQKRLKLFSLD